jgi:hypothetical protein
MLELEHFTAPMGIDLDPFSSPTFNRYVQARRIITADQNAWKTRWHAEAPPPRELGQDEARPLKPSREVWHINPPGSKDGSAVGDAWCAVEEYERRRCFAVAFWVGFNLEQLSRLQRVGARRSPLDFVTLLFRHRHGYRNEETLEIAEQPNHASFLTLMTRAPAIVERFTFKAKALELGHVINGDRR